MELNISENIPDRKKRSGFLNFFGMSLNLCLQYSMGSFAGLRGQRWGKEVKWGVELESWVTCVALGLLLNLSGTLQQELWKWALILKKGREKKAGEAHMVGASSRQEWEMQLELLASECCSELAGCLCLIRKKMLHLKQDTQPVPGALSYFLVSWSAVTQRLSTLAWSL